MGANTKAAEAIRKPGDAQHTDSGKQEDRERRAQIVKDGADEKPSLRWDFGTDGR